MWVKKRGSLIALQGWNLDEPGVTEIGHLEAEARKSVVVSRGLYIFVERGLRKK